MDAKFVMVFLMAVVFVWIDASPAKLFYRKGAVNTLKNLSINFDFCRLQCLICFPFKRLEYACPLLNLKSVGFWFESAIWRSEGGISLRYLEITPISWGRNNYYFWLARDLDGLNSRPAESCGFTWKLAINKYSTQVGQFRARSGRKGSTKIIA